MNAAERLLLAIFGTCPTCGDDGACYVCFDADEPTDTEPKDAS